MKISTILGKILLFFFALGVGLASLRYLSFEVRDILNDRADALQHLSYQFGFYAHVLFGPLALIIGPLQFLPKFRARNLTLHRLMGKIYVICCLLGAIAGFVIAFFTYGGWTSTLGFGLLGVLWFYTTLQAWLSIRKKEVAEHRVWMHRSFALTMSAVTLRLWFPVLQMAGLDFTLSYQIVAWLCWVPNLLLMEWIMRHWKGYSFALN